MAAYFWVGGTGVHDGVTNHYATTSGGAASVANPTTADSVTFDSLSGSATVTFSAPLNCSNLVSSAAANTISPGSQTITCAGTGTIWNFTAGTYTPGTSTIAVTGAAPTFAGGSKVYGTVTITGSGVATITGANTFDNFTRISTAVFTDSVLFSGNQTINTQLTLTGNSAINRLNVAGNLVGTTRIITAAAVSITNADFMDITGAGAASPFTGTSVGDANGNSGITFTTPATQTWSGTLGTTWSTNAWTTRVPLPQDPVLFNVAFSATQTIVADMPRLGKDIDFTGVSGSPVFNTPNNTTIFGSLTMNSGMSRTGVNTVTFAGRGTSTVTSGGNGFQQIVFNGFGGTYTLQDAFSATSTLTLTSGTLNTNSQQVSCLNFATAGILTRAITGGTANWLISQAGALNIISISGSAITVSLANVTFIVTQISSNTRTFTGGGNVFGGLTYTLAGSTGTLVISGSNTFGTLAVSDASNARTLQFTAGTTTTITNAFTVSGTASNLITINSSSAGTPAILSKASGVIARQYLSIQDSTATGGATWYAGALSTNVSGNTGWIFTNPPAAGGVRSPSDRLSSFRIASLSRL